MLWLQLVHGAMPNAALATLPTARHAANAHGQYAWLLDHCHDM